MTTGDRGRHDGERPATGSATSSGTPRTSPARARRTRSTRCMTRARPPLANGQPTAWTTWAAHTDNVAYDVETGHFEPPDAADDANLPTNQRAPPRTRRASPSRRSRAAWALTRTSTAIRTTPATGPTGSRARRRRTTSARRRRRAARRARAPIRSRDSRPTCRGSRRPTTAATLACDHHTGAGCSNPPPGAFYPWYHLLTPPSGPSCAWALTDDGVPGTLDNFGGEQAAWGPLETTDYGFDVRIHNFARTINNPCP